MEMMSGSQINSFLSATSLVWASSIVLMMVGLVYFIKWRESHDSIQNSQFLVLYLFTIALNILEYVMNFVMQTNPSYETIIYKSYILFGFLWNISIIFYMINYLNPEISKSIVVKTIKILLFLAAIIVCIILDIDVTLESNGKFYVLVGILNTTYNISSIIANVVLLSIVLWFRKKMPNGFIILYIITFLIYIFMLIFKNTTGYIIKETVFIYSILLLVIFNTTSNQDKELVHRLTVSRENLTNLSNRRYLINNIISRRLGKSLNYMVLYNDDLYLSPERNRQTIQKDSTAINGATHETLDFINNIKDIYMIEANSIPVNNLYQLNVLTNYINAKIMPFVSSKKVSFNIVVEDNTLLNYIGDINKLEKAIINLLYNVINYSSEGQLITLNIASKHNSKNIELCFDIKNSANTINENLPKLNANDFLNLNKTISKYDLKMIISNKLLEILNSKINIKKEDNNTMYSFTVVQGYKDNILYNSTK